MWFRRAFGNSKPPSKVNINVELEQMTVTIEEKYYQEYKNRHELLKNGKLTESQGIAYTRNIIINRKEQNISVDSTTIYNMCKWTISTRSVY